MIIFVDIETTGLDPELHEIWEVGLVSEYGEGRSWKLPVTLQNADLKALEIGRWKESGPIEVPVSTPVRARFEILQCLTGNVFAGNNPAFDAAFLRRFLGSAPWHYHLVDVKALVAGKLCVKPPWSTEELLLLAGLPTHKAHRALDDARQAKALYDYVYHTHNKWAAEQDAKADEWGL